MRALLAIAAAGELVVGLALLASPPFVVRLLLEAEIAGPGRIVSRIAGSALVALGLACWPVAASRGGRQASLGLLTYGLLAALCLAQAGLTGEASSRLLWPAVAVHLVLGALLAVAWARARDTGR